MSDTQVSALLVNERIAIREQRNSSREKIHNARRAGLTAAPTSKQIDDYDEGEMSNICAALHCGQSGNVSATQLRTLKHLLLHPQGVTSFMKDRSVLNGLIRELSGKRPLHQLEAAYICVNLGLGKEEECLPVCRAAGPYLIHFIEGTSYYLQEAAAWAIGNLAGVSNQCAGIMSAQGAVLQLIKLLSGSQKGLSLAAAYALTHIIHCKAVLHNDEMVELAQLSSSCPSTEPDLCILLYLLSCFPVCEKTLLDNNVVTRSVTILTRLMDSMEKSPKTFTALLRTVGNLSSGLGGVELISLQESGQLIRSLLKAPHEHECKEIAWICANLILHKNEDVVLFAKQAGLSQALEDYKNTLTNPFKP